MDNKKNGYGEFFEDGVLKYFDDSIKYVYGKTQGLMNEKANAKVFNDAVEQRKNPTNIPNASVDHALNNMNDMNGQSESNEKQRVLVRPTPMKIPNMINREQESSYGPQNANRNVYQNVTGDDNPFDSIRNGGSINANTILIVIASLVIVVMLVIICLTIMSNFGIRL